MSEFQLVTRFKPAGDQPEAIRQMVEGLEAGLSHQTLLGVTGSGKTFSVANVIAHVQRPTLVLAPNKTLAAQLYGEFKAFFPNNAVEYFVSYYDYYQPEAYVPSSDTFIEKDASINDHIEQMRLSATKALIERKDVIVVCTVSSIYGLGSPEEYLKMVLHLDRGDKMDQRALLRRLAELQYTRNDMDFARATFRVRGDVIDIFPAESDLEAIRVELFDDEVESLSAFDPLTGEVIKKLPRFTFYPKSHYVTPRETLLDAVEHIKAELKERVTALRERGVTPGLGTVLVGEDPGSVKYVAGKHADCAEVGIESIRVDLPEVASQAEIEEARAKAAAGQRQQPMSKKRQKAKGIKDQGPLETGQDAGVWGGLSEEERRALKRRNKARARNRARLSA